MADRPGKNDPNWLEPPAEQEGLQRYVDTIRERFRLIVLTVAITTGVSILYVLTATKMYEANADLLVTPVNSSDPTLTSLGLIPQSADPTRDVETASRLVTNIEVANRAKAKLKTGESAPALLASVQAAPVATSNIVAITARDSSPTGARDIANAFAEATVANLTVKLHRQIDQLIPRIKAQIGQFPGEATGAGSLGAQLAELQALRANQDPTLRVETPATIPTSQASPRPALSIASGLIAGLVLGIGAAFAAQALDPRLRREEQLRRLYNLPILARVPKEARHKATSEPLAPRRLSPVTAEAYRTLRATLAVSRGQSGPRAILVTGPSPSEGKSTTALSLASSLALAGRRVILVEADLRRPSLANALGIEPKHGGVVSVLIESTDLAAALTPVTPYGPNLTALLADYEGGWIAELFSIPAAQRLIDDAREMADYVVIDSPPLNEVTDALPLARKADDVLIVVRVGQTRLDKLAQLAELLAENEIQPAGFVVVGTPRPTRGEYHYYAGGPGESDRSQPRRQLISPPAASS